MLEVHPPHENVHSWRQFFIHIVAITIGLLIAIGLEQTVVYFHHRHQLQEARGELAAELESNRRVVHINLEENALQNKVEEIPQIEQKKNQH